MPALWVPPEVSKQLRDETRRREAEALKGLVDEHRWKWVQDFNRDLERMWPGMRLLWCPERAPVEAVAMGARPGRWGILLPSATGGPGSVKPLLGPDDGYVEPGSWVFDMLRAQDWWNAEVRHDRRRIQREGEKAAERRKAEERRRADEEVLEMYLARTRTQISMNQDTAWGQNARGAKQMRGQKKKRRP